MQPSEKERYFKTHMIFSDLPAGTYWFYVIDINEEINRVEVEIREPSAWDGRRYLTTLDALKDMVRAGE